MAEEYEQFYRTWCYAGRSVSGADGEKVRAKSKGLALQEAEGLGDLARYWTPIEVSETRHLGRRLALFRRQNDSVLAHGAPVAGLVGGRGGVSFAHVLVGLPRDFSALDAIKLWRSPAWCLEDGDFGSELGRFAWAEGTSGPDFEAPDAAREMLLYEPEVNNWAGYVLRACLAAASGLVEKFYLAGKDDAIARLLFVAFYCLPERLRRQVTFSTHENAKSTKGVQVVGVTTFEGEGSDFAAYCYGGKYCALNLFNGTKAEDLTASSFAESAIQWIVEGYPDRLTEVRDSFDALDPADSPTVSDLDLLAEWASTGGGGPVEAEMLMKLCGSVAIGHLKIRDRKGLSVLVEQARQNNGLRDGVTSRLASWLPRHDMASKEFPAVLAEVAFGKLREGQAFEEVSWLADFARRVGTELAKTYWDELLVLCQGWVSGGALAEAPLPAVATRLSLLGVWHQWHRLPEARDGDAFADVVGCWLRVVPQDLRVVLDSELRDELKREAVEIWAGSPSLEEFGGVVKLARDDGRFRGQVVGQLVGLLKERRDALGRFPSSLAGLALGDLRSKRPFEEFEWLATFAREISPGLAPQFWEGFLLACRPVAGEWASGKAQLPTLDIRVKLLQEWEVKVPRAWEQAMFRALVDCWLRVTPQDLVQVLKLGISSKLKGEAVKFCLTGSAPVDAQTADVIFNLVCKDVKLTSDVFLGLPKWQGGAGGALGKLPEACLSRLLVYQAEQMRLVDMQGDGLLDTVVLWNTRAPRVMPARMLALLCFGQYVRNPSAFAQKTQFALELLEPDFWKRERERDETVDAAVNGAVDSLLSRGDLGGFVQALEWFGDKWTTSGAQLIQLAHSRLLGVSVPCRDAGLRRLLVVLGGVLKEWREARSGGGAAASGRGGAVIDVGAEEYEVLARVAMGYLPGSSLLMSATGQQVIAELQNQDQLLGTLQKEWVQKLRSLTEIRGLIDSKAKLEHVRVGALIGSLASAYTAMDREEDHEVRDWINGLLLTWVELEASMTTSILFQFMREVYGSKESLFLGDFIDPFRQGLLSLEQQTGSGLVASEFVRWCDNPDVKGIFARRPGLVVGWLRQFVIGLSEKSLRNTDWHLSVVIQCSEETMETWRKVSGYKRKWFRTRVGRAILVYALVPALLGGAGVLGVGGWFVLQERDFRKQDQGLSRLLDRYQAEVGAAGSGQVEAERAIREVGIPALLRMAGKKDSAVGRRAAKLFHLTSEEEWHRRAIDRFAMLGSAGAPAVGELGKLLEDKKPGVRSCAAACLGEIGGEGKDVLLRHLDDPDGSVSVAVSNAVQRIEQGAVRKGGER